MYIEIKDNNSSIKSTRQIKAQVDTTQREKKKQTINQSNIKTLCK
jgi:hypothetical protein